VILQWLINVNPVWAKDHAIAAVTAITVKFAITQTSHHLLFQSNNDEASVQLAKPLAEPGSLFPQVFPESSPLSA
jgi:hypothetical protein